MITAASQPTWQLLAGFAGWLIVVPTGLLLAAWLLLTYARPAMQWVALVAQHAAGRTPRGRRHA